MNKVNHNNFILFAAHHYDNVNCVDEEEFREDLARIKYLSKLFKRYKETNQLRTRLILNHLVVLYNVFVPQACTMMLCLKLEPYLPCIKTFLIFLGYWPDKIDGVSNKMIISSDIPIDQNIANELRNVQ